MSKIKIDPQKFYAPPVAAKFLGVTPDTVKAYCRKGKLKGERGGLKQVWRIRGSVLQEFHARWKLATLE